jgi:hypothetical protein
MLGAWLEVKITSLELGARNKVTPGYAEVIKLCLGHGMTMVILSLTLS